MNFVLNKDDLLKPLQSMLSVANSKSTMPLLSCILFDISEGNLKITASDLDTEISCNIAINCDKSIKVVKQSEQTTKGLLMKGQQMIIMFCEIFKKFIQVPVLLYLNFAQWTIQNDNDFIKHTCLHFAVNF